jgi:type IV pilus assembly protein PilW
MKLLSKQTGISLVEVLVALVISLFLLGGIVQVYVGNKVTFKFTNALAEVQENGRFALDMMSQDLRLANQWGCVAFDPTDTSNINDTLNGTHPGYDADFHDFLSPAVTLPGAIAGTNNAGLNGSDTLVVRGGKPGQTNVEGPFTAATTQSLNVNPIGSIGAGDIILVARCGEYLLNIPEADILSVSSVDTTNPVQTVINVAANKSQQFENDAMVIELQTVTYTIGLAASGSGELALFRQEFNGVVEELVEGVEDMQVLYGIDSDNDQFPNQYVTSDLVPNFNAVVSLRIMLLIHSIDDFVTEAPQTYTFNGVLTTPADRRLRQVFSTTIALRNRIG